MTDSPAPGSSAATPSSDADSSESGGGESLATVLIALGVNAVIAVVKTVVAVLTGSAAMVAEAFHSWADAGNEVFLLLAERRAGRAADARHPVGYGRAAYVWSMVAAFGLFAVGAAVSVWHGVSAWGEPEAESDYTIAYIVLGVAFALEAVSFLNANRRVGRDAARRHISRGRFLSRTSNPTLRAVWVEDASALIGLAIAAGAMALHQATGDPRWDAAGSILVGVLLGVVAVFLLSRNMAFLVGEVADPAVRSQVLTWLLERPEVLSVSYLHLEYVGPEKVLVVGAVDLAGDERESAVAVALQRVEDAMLAHPNVAAVVLSLSNPGHAPLEPGAVPDVTLRGGAPAGR